MNFKLLFLALFVSLIAISCSKDKKNNPIIPDNNKSYLPMKEGNYWIYDTYDLDMQNNPQTITLAKDSLVVMSKTIYFDKEAYLFKQYTNGELRSDNHFYSEGNKIYTESKYILPMNNEFGLPLDKIPGQWILLADFDASSWQVLTHKFVDEPISIGDLPGLTLTADYTVAATKAGTANFQVAGQQVQATEITIRHTIGGNLKLSFFNIPLNFVINQRLYFAQDYGLVKTFTESQTISILVPGVGNQSFEINGHVKNLVRLNINK